jgi:hypothetical protein
MLPKLGKLTNQKPDRNEDKVFSADNHRWTTKMAF